jgi:hypothetical protein
MRAMSDAPLHYNLTEIRSYLPTGWNLVNDENPGRWNPKKRVWEVAVHDGADMTWTVRVPTGAATERGRLEALRIAMNKVYREGIGKDGFFG